MICVGLGETGFCCSTPVLVNWVGCCTTTLRVLGSRPVTTTLLSLGAGRAIKGRHFLGL